MRVISTNEVDLPVFDNHGVRPHRAERSPRAMKAQRRTCTSKEAERIVVRVVWIERTHLDGGEACALDEPPRFRRFQGHKQAFWKPLRDDDPTVEHLRGLTRPADGADALEGLGVRRESRDESIEAGSEIRFRWAEKHINGRAKKRV